MKLHLRTVVALCAGLAGLASLPLRAESNSPRLTLKADSVWRFMRGDPSGAEAPGFADAAWRTVELPHDWSIEGPFDEHSPTGGAGGFLPAGIGWYRKHFTLPQDDAQKRVFIDFDGVMANSDVWINGFHLGKRPYGYVSFRYELTGHLTYGDTSPNVLADRSRIHRLRKNRPPVTATMPTATRPASGARIKGRISTDTSAASSAATMPSARSTNASIRMVCKS